MTLRDLKLTNFRNLKGEFSLSSGINLLIAPNGSGKTNFLEALYFLSSGKSFRTNTELFGINQDLLQLETVAFARVSGLLADSLGNETSLEVILERVNRNESQACKKVLKINTNKTTVTKFANQLRTIVFSPNTIDLVAGTPSVRRRDLDEFLSMYDPSYFKVTREYAKIIRGRNKLLERLQQGFGKRDELNFWNTRLAELGSTIILQRLEMIERINPLIAHVASDLFNGGKNDLSIVYMSKFIEVPEQAAIKQAIAKKLSENMHKEVSAGISLYGPQREDFVFLLNDADLKEFGSRGQQRLSAFLYKMAQRLLLGDHLEHIPMLLLDDLFSELDPEVCLRIQTYIQDLQGQIILTALRESDFDDTFFKESSSISI